MHTSQIPHPSRLAFDPAAIFSAIERNIARANEKASYPPFNIVQHNDDTFSIEMALAGFSQSEINIDVEGSSITITADGTAEDKQGSPIFLHQGIAHRGFKRTFCLGEHIKVEEARMTDGILEISLLRDIPEEKKPRRLEIKPKN
jgi:molecular chaperone IbpA